MSTTPVFRGKVILKQGIFPKIPQPEMETFASRRQEWEISIPGCEQYKELITGEKM
jgi:hypothetical protein